MPFPVTFTSTDTEPPRIQCPSVKEKSAEPNKLTARVFWDTPEGRDTADGILTEWVKIYTCAFLLLSLLLAIQQDRYPFPFIHPFMLFYSCHISLLYKELHVWR